MTPAGRRIRAGLLLALLAALPSGAAPHQKQKIYRWKDAKGAEHVTSTPPPADAFPLDVPPAENVREPEPPAKATPKPAAPVSPHTHQLPAEAEARWQALEQRLVAARVRHDHPALDAAVDEVLAEARWGRGLRALLLLPLALVALGTLLGWGLGRGPLGVGAGALLGLLLAHGALVAFIQRPQAARLAGAVTDLLQHLGAPRRTQPTRIQLAEAQAAALPGQARFLRAPWAFSGDVEALQATLRQVVREP